jgi:3',5'-cyclic AMP phosphodiesterase CpdA
MNIKLTLFSDTHSKHKWIPTDHLPGGDILLHTGDISSMGYEHELLNFLNWFNEIPSYFYKVFIAGNHDWIFQKQPDYVKRVMENYPNITYLQDDFVYFAEWGLKIYGSPWQPEFYNWAFNLPRNGKELEEVWNKIPDDTDILLTHGPAHGFVDKVIGRYENLGCEKLAERIRIVQPTLHVCGHIHSGNGVDYNDQTTHINASVLDERYEYAYTPYNIELNLETKEVEIIV